VQGGGIIHHHGNPAVDMVVHSAANGHAVVGDGSPTDVATLSCMPDGLDAQLE